MKTDLKERYIYAVVRHLPTKAQADVEKELDSLITEMLDERRGNGNVSSEQDLRNVLTELGTPEELALKYCGEERTALISGTYFLMYKRVLSIALPIVLAVVAGSNILGFILGAELLHINFLFINITTASSSLFTILPNALGAALSAFVIITIIFAILDYYKVKLQSEDILANLPEKPGTNTKISIGESIFSIVMSVVFVVVFLGYPQTIAATFDGVRMTVFDVPVIYSLWLPIVLWAAISIGTEVIKMIAGFYTARLAAIVVIGNIIVAVCAIVVFGNNNIINPEFIGFMQSVILNYEGAYWLVEVFANINLVILSITMIALVIETIAVLVKVFLSRRAK